MPERIELQALREEPDREIDTMLPANDYGISIVAHVGKRLIWLGSRSVVDDWARMWYATTTIAATTTQAYYVYKQPSPQTYIDADGRQWIVLRGLAYP